MPTKFAKMNVIDGVRDYPENGYGVNRLRKQVSFLETHMVQGEWNVVSLRRQMIFQCD